MAPRSVSSISFEDAMVPNLDILHPKPSTLNHPKKSPARGKEQLPEAVEDPPSWDPFFRSRG